MESKEVVMEKLTEFLQDLKEFASKTHCAGINCKEECPVGKKLCQAICANIPKLP